VASSLPEGTGYALEIGAGAGNLKAQVRNLLNSEVFVCPGIDLVLDGSQLPFKKGILRGIVLINVLHHIPESPKFLKEAARCVKPGGTMVMVEPWVTPWSKLIYQRHHEGFDIETPSWEFSSSGHLSGANQALPWIVFKRDIERFTREHSEWEIEKIEPHMPFLYLLSGGMTLRSLMPGWMFGAWENFEFALSPLANDLAMFALIVLHRAHPADTKVRR
jgi:SAM-dependent methyltransferase